MPIEVYKSGQTMDSYTYQAIRGLIYRRQKMEIQVTSFDITTGITTTRTEYVVLDVPASVMIKAGA